MQAIAKQTVDLDDNHLSLWVLTLVAKIVAPRLANIEVRMTFAGNNGLLDYRQLF